MRINTQECSQQETPVSGSIVANGVRFHYNGRIGSPPAGPCIMWLHDGTVVVERSARIAKFYALVFLMTQV